MKFLNRLFKTRIQFNIKGSEDIKIGYLIKDKKYTNGFKIETTDKKEIYTTTMISDIKKNLNWK